ncbi:protein SOB FIVE-LIKE 5-like isoform X1 [Primulina huaijiensis]|uniref:protein SOB FIVE-LIKE 5-like isoform X1 n=1 Tax=Primulina huaijiensis TaxID=1492673 RepID=UPI003CC72AAB
MNISTSECSSECESGWTMYLDQTSNSTDRFTRDFSKNWEENAADSYAYQDQEDDEDLSMVSDASSGPPPHLQEYENYAAEGRGGGGEKQFFRGYASSVSEDSNKKKIKQKSKAKETRDYQRQQNFCLADTAISPVFHFPQDNVAPSGFSQVFSAANFENESIPKKQTGFLKSSTNGKSGSFLGRKRQ